MLSGERGLQLNTLEDMYRFAQYIVASGMAPRGMEKAEAVVTAIQLGDELGLKGPMTSVQNIAVINGRPSLWGDAMLGLCKASGVFDPAAFVETWEGVPYEDNYTATCTVGRRGEEPITRSFSVADAKRATLWANPKKTPWINHPKRMLQMRARSWALRDAFPDILKGLQTPDEVDAVLSQLDLGEQPASRTDALAEKLRKQATEPVAAAKPKPAAKEIKEVAKAAKKRTSKAERPGEPGKQGTMDMSDDGLGWVEQGDTHA
jgi:hypothetical protein